MTSALERFRNRKNLSMNLQVRWPPETDTIKPAIEFTVKRLPPAVKNNIIFDARAAMKREGIEAPAHVPTYVVTVVKDEHGVDVEEEVLTPEWSAYYAEFNAKWAYYFYDQAKNHFAGWKPLKEGDELPPFSQAALAELVSFMSIPEKQALGYAYQVAEAEDEKKSAPPTTSATAS